MLCSTRLCGLFLDHPVCRHGQRIGADSSEVLLQGSRCTDDRRNHGNDDSVMRLLLLVHCRDGRTWWWRNYGLSRVQSAGNCCQLYLCRADLGEDQHWNDTRSRCRCSARWQRCRWVPRYSVCSASAWRTALCRSRTTRHAAVRYFTAPVLFSYIPCKFERKYEAKTTKNRKSILCAIGASYCN